MIETAVIELLRKTVVPLARQSEGTFFVEYGRPFKAVAVGAWLMLAATAAICFLPSTGIGPRTGYAIVGGVLLLTLFLHSEFFFVRITYNIASINVHSRWGGHRRTAWPEIESVGFSKASQNYVVKLHNGTKFTFSYFMSGYQSFLGELQARTNAAAQRPI
jgi:hypothetical protein